MTTKKQKERFSSAEDDRILELVQANECIWNVSCHQFRNNDLKHRIWNNFAQTIDRDGEYLFKL